MNAKIAMRRLACICFLVVITNAAYGYPPETRYSCELGWMAAEVETSQVIDPADFIDIRLSTRGDDGGALRCSLALWKGLYAYGEYARSDAMLDVTLTLDGEAGTGTFGIDAEFQRFGLGYSTRLTDRVRVFGQIAYLYSDYDFDQIFVALESGAGNLGPSEFRNRRSGIDLLGGASWKITDKVELGGYARLATNNRLTFDSASSIAFEPKNKDDFRVGGKIKLHVVEGFFISGEVEFGDMDTVFAGMGIQF